MKRLLFVLVIALAVLAAPTSAQFIGRTVTVANLGACQNLNAMAYVTDATNATTLGAGGGSAGVFVNCNSGSWAIDEVAAVADLSAYLPVSGTTAAPVVIQNSGAGNDVSLIALDDLILTPGDALTVAPGGNAAITTTAGNVTFTAGGTTQDASLISTDDVFLTPDDALVAIAGGATTITSTAGTVAIASSAGAVTVTAVGATNDITLTATDDVVLAPTDALTGTVGGAVAVTTTAGAITLTAGGTTQDISLISVDQVILDGEGGADELTIDAASTTVIGAFKLTGSSAPPVACAGGTAGTLYYDSDINKMCLCTGTNYVLIDDQSTTTGCS